MSTLATVATVGTVGTAAPRRFGPYKQLESSNMYTYEASPPVAQTGSRGAQGVSDTADTPNGPSGVGGFNFEA